VPFQSHLHSTQKFDQYFSSSFTIKHKNITLAGIDFLAVAAGNNSFRRYQLSRTIQIEEKGRKQT